MALGGRRLVNTRNNQPKVGGRDRGDFIEERVRRRSMGGYTVQSFGAANGRRKKKSKTHRGLNWPPIGKLTHNNQPKTGGRDR